VWEGQLVAKTGIEPFGRLVDDAMTVEPYCSARTVYWIVDNGSSHAGKASIDRLESAYDNLRLIHLPIHAPWLNQIELYFSIVQRKALTPNDLTSTRSRRSPTGCSALAGTTARSPDRSRGRSRETTSTGSSHASATTDPRSRSPHDHRTCGRVY